MRSRSADLFARHPAELLKAGQASERIKGVVAELAGRDLKIGYHGLALRPCREAQLSKAIVPKGGATASPVGKVLRSRRS